MTATEVRPELRRFPLWALVVSEALCVVGLGISAYLTYVHFNNPTGLASYSVIFGVPVPVAGLAFFAGMVVLCSPWAWRMPQIVVLRLRVAASMVGVAMILYLIYVELFRLDAICLWCTSIHAITVILFMTIAFSTAAATSVGRYPADS